MARGACLVACAALLVRSALAASYASACDPAIVRPLLPALPPFDRCALLRARPAAAADDAPALRLLWRMHDGNVTMAVHVDAPLSRLGYVAVGAGWNGGMKGAELWVARLVPENSANNGATAFSLDAMWSADYVCPAASAAAAAALTLLGWASGGAGGAAWAFTRRADVAAASAAGLEGATQMPLAQPGGDLILWAIGTGDAGEFGYHGATLRGSRRVLLAPSAAPLLADLSDPPDAKTLAIRTPPIATDGTPSRYCWSWHKLPADRKYHITKVAPFLANPGLKSLVHHMVTYACPASFEDGGGGRDADTLRAGGVVCRNEGSMPPACPQNFIGWADAGTIVYPPEAGFPFGAAGETRSILLEMHYENLAGTRGIVDSSGLEFTYTAVLRPHDLGYLIVGDALERQAPQVQRAPQVLPAGHAAFEVANLCPASCTRRMAEEDMHVVSTTFHMHVKGVHTYLELFRDGTRHGRISQPHWDFLKQDALPGNGLVIHPGDELLTRCVYNTRNASSLLPPYTMGPAATSAAMAHDVAGGFGTYDAASGRWEEMCYAFVLAWPRPRRSTCLDLRNTGWPGVVYCEADATHRMLPRNVMLQPSDARTAKYETFELERAAAAAGAAASVGARLPPPPQPQMMSF